MVEEINQIVQQQKEAIAQIETQKQQIQKASPYIERTAQQLLNQTPNDLYKLQDLERQNSIIKNQALQSISEQQIQAQQNLDSLNQIARKNQLLQTAYRAGVEGKFIGNLSGDMQKAYQDGANKSEASTTFYKNLQQEAYAKQLQAQLPQMEKVIVNNGKVGIESQQLKQSVPIENYSSLINKASANPSFLAPTYIGSYVKNENKVYEADIDYGSFYKNLDAKFGGKLPGGISPTQVMKAKEVANETLNNFKGGNNTSVSITSGKYPTGAYSFVVNVKENKQAGPSFLSPTNIGSREVNNNGRPIVPSDKVDRPISMETLPQKGDKIQQFQEYLNRDSVKQGKYSVLAGFAVEGLNLIGFGKEVLTTNPITTIKNAEEGFLNVGKRFISGEGFPEVGRELRDNPGFATGRVAGNILLYKGPDFLAKGVDVFRTRGLTELPGETIIAPEYFKGQNYPQVYKGQTAGQLLKEFIDMPETFQGKPAGFTSAPQPLKGLEVTKSTSELPGLYQAPRLNPSFLGVSGEKGLIGLDFFPRLRPSAFKIAPEGFELVKGVSPMQTGLTPIGKARAFFNDGIEAGKSYVPFIKYEKESVLAPGTILNAPTKRYFFEFEGRKIPILEYETAGGKAVKGSQTAGDVISSYARGQRNPSIINPYSTFVTASKISSINSKSSFSNLSYPSYSKSQAPTYTFIPVSSKSIKATSSSFNAPSSSSKVIGSSSYSFAPRSYNAPSSSGYDYTSSARFYKSPPSYPPRIKLSSSSDDYSKKRINKGLPKRNLFLAQIRKRGKFITVGKAPTVRDAFGIGKKAIRNSLAVSTRVLTPQGKAIKLFPDSPDLTRSKKDPFIIIQKKNTRLASLRERQEIKASRRSKSKNKTSFMI